MNRILGAIKNWRFNIKFTALFILIGLAKSCVQKDNELKQSEDSVPTLFSLLPSEKTGIDFVNKVVNKPDFNIFKYRNLYNGGGVAIGDVNNDGLPDIYLTGNMVPNKLYLNKGNMTFEDITKTAGVEGNKPWSTGVCMVDVNADGLLDIYVSNAGNMEGDNHDNDLFINNGVSEENNQITFTESAKEFNLAKTGFTTHASFFDYDKDGDLDAYILNNSNVPVSSLGYAEQREVRAQDWKGVPDIFKGVGDMLLRNDNGKFVDVSKEAGIYGSLIGFGLGVMVADLNKDLYPDLYISNDFYERDYLYINNQDGTFSEEIKKWTSHLSLSAMGIDVADINNDGHADIFITDMLPEENRRVKAVMEFESYDVFKLKQGKDFHQQYIQNTLQLNNGNGSFSEIAYFSGVDATDWSWAGLIFDMDNDGLRDIYVTNGINHDLTDLDFVDFFANEIIQKMALTGQKASIDSIINKMPVRPQPNYAYRNNGDLTFKNANSDWGFDLPSLSNGAAYADLDNDGDLDLVVNNVNMNAFVYENNTNDISKHSYLKLVLHGSGKNKFAIGATALLYSNNTVIMQELMPFRGFQSSMDYTMTIGLGEIQTIDSLRVIWPDDRTQLVEKIPTNQTMVLNQSEAFEHFKSYPKEKVTPLLLELPNTSLIEHKENNYNDFNNEGLIYKLLSQEGPSLAVGDIDGDANEDIYIGGAKGQAGMIYLHKGDGALIISKQSVFESDSSNEDTAAAFLDIDSDGDLDLMVGSGGNELNQDRTYITRLYLNDGKGNFTRSLQSLPAKNTNISVIAPQDFDQDGDIDVFIGSRSIVGTYGVDPDHLFLVNNGDGTFEESTDKILFEVKHAGMVTDAFWTDIDGDKKPDLVTVSEWGTPKIYKNMGRRFTPMATSMDSLNGWWNTVTAADLDNDGDEDLILGNQGTNLHYKPSRENPMRMWINDFDENGSIEQIFTQSQNGKDFPIHQKRELTAQLVNLKKANLRASEYSIKTIGDLFDQEIFNNSIKKSAAVSKSIIAVNQGNGNFKIVELPSRVQFSSICGITCADVNEDGFLDLIMGGNDFEFKPQYSRMDASFGHVLLGNGKIGFEWQEYSKSGFFIKGEIKHLNQFKDAKGKKYIIVAINNEKPKVFKLNSTNLANVSK